MDIMNRNTDEDTVRIRRPSRVFTSPLGHTVWMGRVEPCTLELEDAHDTDPLNHCGAWLDSPPRRKKEPKDIYRSGSLVG